jgi:tetraacyldisaccharide 4'-kinase
LTRAKSPGYNTVRLPFARREPRILRGRTINASQLDHLMSGAQPGLAAALTRLGLAALSQPYGWCVALRNQLYDRGWLPSHQVGVPVISVGNLTAGGTGKTPAVEYLARFYRQQGLQVAILSRGYGGSGGRNDEALVLEENLPGVPHLQGGNRVALASAAADEFGSDILILDDGFQHRRLARALDLVLIDATRPWGHGRLLPRGLLREPVESLRRADLVLLTRVSQSKPASLQRLQNEIGRLAPHAIVAESVHRPLEWVDAAGQSWPLERIDGKPVAALCGIGNPQAFRHTLTVLTPNLIDFRSFADHQRYSRRKLARLEEWARQQPAEAVIATTQKDLVKLKAIQLGGRPLLALRIGLEIVAGRERFEQALRGVLTTGARRAA